MDSSSQHIPCIHPEPCDACLAFRTIDDEVNAMELALRQLKDRRQAAITNMNQSHDIITRMPTEIIAHIFYLYVHDEPTGILSRVFHLALVSKSWRDIALSSPELWTTFTLLRSMPMLDYPPADLVETWLQRSGALKVNVTLTMGRRKGLTGYCDESLRDVLGPLHRHIDRLGPSSKFTIFDGLLFPVDFPADLVSKFIIHMGRLTVIGQTALGRLPTVFRHIKRLIITSHTAVLDAWDVLRSCPLLEECNFNLRDIREEIAAQQTPTDIHHTHLSHLYVDLGHNASFLAPLRLPRLVSFGVKMQHIERDVSLLQDTDMRHLASMITLSNTDLEGFSFEMTSQFWNDSQTQILLNLLQHQPRLHTLTLSLIFWQLPQGAGGAYHVDTQDRHVAGLIECFLDSVSGPPFLPNLKHFRYANKYAQSWAPIAAFYDYHSKNKPVRPLSTADFSEFGTVLIDEQSLAVFLTLPSTDVKFRMNVRNLAESIAHYGHPTPGKDVLLYYDGLEEALERCHQSRRSARWLEETQTTREG